MNASKFARLGVGAALVLALIVVVYLNRHDLPDIERAVERSSHVWLAVGTGLFLVWLSMWTLLQAACRRAVGAGGYHEFPRLVPLTSAAIALNLVVKSGNLAGIVFFSADARKRSVPATRVNSAYLLSVAFVDFAFIVPIAAAVGVAVHDRKLPWPEAVAVAVFTALILVRAALLVAAFRNKDFLKRLHALPFQLWDRLRRRAPRPVEDSAVVDEVYDVAQLIRRRPMAAAPAFVFAVSIDVVGISMLWAALAAVGGGEHFLVAIVAYVMSVVFASIGLIPGGLGVTEIGATAVLASFGIPIGVAAAAVLIFRVWEYWLPLLTGLLTGWVLRVRDRRTDAEVVA